MSQSIIIEELLAALEGADDQLRGIYRDLSSNPDSADERAEEIRELRDRRRTLAQRVGLELLAQRRASQSISTPDAETPPSVPVPVDSDVAVSTTSESTSVREPSISAEALDEWKAKARTSGIGAKSYTDEFVMTWETTLDKLMRIVGPPREVALEAGDEIDALDRVSEDHTLAMWSALPQRKQQLWLTMLAARARAVKDLHLGGGDRGRLKTFLERARQWASDQHPGHVHGMNNGHGPQHGDWTEDSRRHWAALEAMLEADPKSRRSPYVKKSRGEEPADELRSLDPAWPLWPLVRGRKVLMIGGDPREASRQRLERVFELESLEWAEPGPRRTQAIVERIERRSLDMVVVIRGFVDHAVAEPIVAASKSAGVPWVIADRYGVVAMKLAFERFLGRTQQQEVAADR